MMEQKKRLYRSRNDRVIAGVIGGWARYLGLDPSLLRLAFVILVFFTALSPNVFLYSLMGTIEPLQPLVNALIHGGDYPIVFPYLPRIAFTVVVLLSSFFPGAFLYLLMAIIVPLEPKSQLAEAGAAD